MRQVASLRHITGLNEDRDMNGIITFAIKQRILVVIFLVSVLGAGFVSFLNLNIEAYPDPVPPLIEVIAQASGQSAEEIERYYTIPIEVAMEGIPNVKVIQSVSLFGLSDVLVNFTFGYSYREAKQEVINRLGEIGTLPGNIQPQLSPNSPVGEIYRYRVVGPPGYSLVNLKTLEDWVLQRRFKAVPGVIDVTGWGGRTKSYDVNIDQDKLVAYGLTVQQILTVLNNSNINVGGQTVDFAQQSAIVRGVGLITSIDRLRETMLTVNNGVPVVLGDVATVTVGNLPRLGIAGQDKDDDVVEGIILMNRDGQSKPTIAAVEAEVEKINTTGVLPPGVHVERIYDRADLISLTTTTVLHNMVEGIFLIFLVQWIFLGNLRSAFIVALTIPFALACAVIIMVARGESANLLSVGAIDFGLVVDATVIMMENIFRRLSLPPMQRGTRAALAGGPRATGELRGKFRAIAESAFEVNKSIFFSAAIIIAGFLPLFTLTGIEGHIFGPMAKTYAYALAGGLFATFTITPALSSLLLPAKLEETETIIVRFLHRLYHPAIRLALANRILVLGLAGLVLAFAVVEVQSLGLEFLPKLEEGNFWIRATLPTSVGLEATSEYVDRMRELFLDYPEVETVVSQHGRPDDGTDATGFFNAEFFVPLKRFDSWPKGVTKESLTKVISDRLKNEFPGVDFNFSQNIEDNVEEATSGVKGENSIKLFGNELEVLEKTANQIKDAMANVPGITDLAVFPSLGQPTVEVQIDHLRAARYGLQPGDINATLQAAIGGQAAGNFYERGSDRNFPIMVRLAPEFRSSLDAIRRIPIGAPAPNGTGVVQIPLSDVADVKLVSGPAFVYREGQTRYIPIKFSVRGRDLGGAVLEAQKAVADHVVLPGGYHLEWVGEFGNLQDAIARLEVVVPIAIGLILVLLYVNFSSVRDTLLAASVIPMAMLGGIFSLAVTGTPFSVSAAIGFIALFGIAAMDGIIVIAFYNNQLQSGLDKSAALIRACETQMRPVVLTCAAACVGLLPAAFSTGIGSQVQKPLALVVVGGILLAPVLILMVLPVLISLFSRHAETLAAREAEKDEESDDEEIAPEF
jgi:cobalt-zinc-cadmium resistance protein CzcA